MPKVKGPGTTLSYLPAYNDGGNPTLVGALTQIGEISVEAGEIEHTTLDSTGGWREFMQGLREMGELPITGYHDNAQTGQALCRTQFGSGALGYYWITFTDGTVIAFNAFIKGYKAGAPDLEGLISFGATLRVSGLVQILTIKDAVQQAKTNGQTATMDSTAVALVGTVTYQWYSNNSEDYLTPTIIGGATSATYTTGALTPGTYYYYCVVTVSGFRPVNSGIHKIVVT